MKSLTMRNYFFPTAEIESAVGSLMFFLHSFYIFFVNEYLQDNLIESYYHKVHSGFGFSSSSIFNKN